MKGKTLENLVLGAGVVVIGSASFLMFYDKAGVAAKSVNIIFSAGFIIYIIYSYVLSNNLNGVIYDLKKHVSNLKEEINRLTQTLAERNQTIATQNADIATKASDIVALQSEIAEKSEALLTALNELESAKAKQAKQK